MKIQSTGYLFEIKDLKNFDTEISEIFLKTEELFKKFPEVLTSITSDLDNRGLRKKHLRSAVKQYKDKQINGTDYLIEFPSPENDMPLHLRDGRPRIKPELVLHFLVLRGLWGSLSDYNAVERLYDSKAVEAVLSSHCYEYPGISTIRENINAISNSTRELIIKCQAQMILESYLDNFSKIYIDSMAVSGNTAYPTDISILYKLVERAYRKFKALEKFKFPALSDGWIPERLERMRKHLAYMSMQVGKHGVKGKVKESYRSFSHLASNLIESFYEEQEKLTPYWENAQLPPVQEVALEALWFAIDNDINAAAYVLWYAELSINEDIKLPSVEKILSVSDKDVAYIKKGQRNAVIGYKPQIARSQNGFICGYITPLGNATDSSLLIPMVEKVILTTGVTPFSVSVDDGYSSEQNVRQLKEVFKIPVTSFSGSKGKELTKYDWDSTSYIEERRMRSAIESTIFTIKYNHRFGTLRRRNIYAVNAEQLEKIIAYNFVRMVRKGKEQLLKEAS